MLSIVRIRTDLNLSAETYGMITNMISLVLVVGPLCFSSLFHRFGNAAGALLALAFSAFPSCTLYGSFFHPWGCKRRAKCPDRKLYDESHSKRTAKQSNARLSLIIQTSVCIGFIGAGFVHVHRYPKHAVYRWHRHNDRWHFRFYLEQCRTKKGIL